MSFCYCFDEYHDEVMGLNISLCVCLCMRYVFVCVVVACVCVCVHPCGGVHAYMDTCVSVEARDGHHFPPLLSVLLFETVSH